MTEEVTLTITSARFRDFKAFKDFSVSFRHMNILVGPNNAGKSTVIGALRALSAAMQRARARNPEPVPAPEGTRRRGWSLQEDSIPISLENVHTEYESIDSSVEFRISNGSSLSLFFPADGGSYLIPEHPERVVLSASSFRSQFPLRVGVVPILGQVEHDEAMVTDETVRRNLATNRASRHFRNYWLRAEADDFSAFRERVRSTWVGMDIERPYVELAHKSGESVVVMFCKEERATRELYWAGAGFQVWCQILTHVVRESTAQMLVVDEPEIYLHPDVQRQLLTILRDLGPDVVIATHSSEIVSNAETGEILLVDKRARSAKRVTGIEGVRAALARLGSAQNFALTQLARTQKLIFVEGSDFKLLALFARKLGLSGLAAGTGFATAPTGGFPTPPALRAAVDGMNLAMGTAAKYAGVFDRDYRSDDETLALEAEFRSVLSFARVLRRKELENYLLVPDALDRAIQHALSDTARRNGKPPSQAAPAADVLSELAEDFRIDTQIQVLDRAAQFQRKTGSTAHATTLHAAALREFEENWRTLAGKVQLVPGKDLLARMNQRLQTLGISLTPTEIIRQMRRDEIAPDLASTLRELEKFAEPT